MGDAYQWPAPLKYPVLNGWVKFKNNHVAAVTGIVGDVVVIVDSNADGTETIRVGQTYKMDDPRIEGFGFQGVLASNNVSKPL